MKKTIILLIIFINIATLVFATETGNNTKEYNLEQIGMRIQLDDKLIEIISSIKNNDEIVETLENKEAYIQNYNYSGVILDAIDNINEKPTKEVLVASLTNSNYASMENLNQLSDEDINTFKTKLLESLKQQTNNSAQYEVIKDELIKTQNGNTYINIVTNLKTEDTTTDISIYYTVMNGRFITISFRYFSQSEQVQNELERQTVENIQFYEVERPVIKTNENMRIALGVTAIFFVLITVMVIIIRIKDRRLLNKNIKDIKYKQYSKFGGLMLFFWVLCFYQILLRVNDITAAAELKDMQFYTNAVTLQSTILALIAMYQIYITPKRKEDTPKKIIRANLIMTIAGFVITLARIIYAIFSPLEIYNSEYFKQEASILLFSIIYPLIWTIYFTFSARVQTYYYMPQKNYKEILYETKIYKFFQEKKNNRKQKQEREKDK